MIFTIKKFVFKYQVCPILLKLWHRKISLQPNFEVSNLKSKKKCATITFPECFTFQANHCTHLSTAVAWREKICKRFVFHKYFCLVLGLLKSRISKKSNEGLERKADFMLFHYKARVQPVSKITTIATRNRC